MNMKIPILPLALFLVHCATSWNSQKWESSADNTMQDTRNCVSDSAHYGDFGSDGSECVASAENAHRMYGYASKEEKDPQRLAMLAEKQKEATALAQLWRDYKKTPGRNLQNRKRYLRAIIACAPAAYCEADTYKHLDSLIQYPEKLKRMVDDLVTEQKMDARAARAEFANEDSAFLLKLETFNADWRQLMAAEQEVLPLLLSPLYQCDKILERAVKSLTESDGLTKKIRTVCSDIRNGTITAIRNRMDQADRGEFSKVVHLKTLQLLGDPEATAEKLTQLENNAQEFLRARPDFGFSGECDYIWKRIRDASYAVRTGIRREVKLKINKCGVFVATEHKKDSNTHKERKSVWVQDEVTVYNKERRCKVDDVYSQTAKIAISRCSDVQVPEKIKVGRYEERMVDVPNTPGTWYYDYAYRIEASFEVDNKEHNVTGYGREQIVSKSPDPPLTGKEANYEEKITPMRQAAMQMLIQEVSQKIGEKQLRHYALKLREKADKSWPDLEEFHACHWFVSFGSSQPLADIADWKQTELVIPLMGSHKSSSAAHKDIEYRIQNWGIVSAQDAETYAKFLNQGK